MAYENEEKNEEKRKDFMMFRSYFDAIKRMNFESQGRLYNAMFSYIFDNIDINIDKNFEGAEAAILEIIMPLLQANKRNYSNGKKPKNKQNATKKEAKAKRQGSDKEATKKRPTSEVEAKAKARNKEVRNKDYIPPSGGNNAQARVGDFTSPSLSEIISYCEEKKLTVDAKVFFNYFTEGNWIDGKGNKVRNWKQKLLTWNSHENKSAEKNNGSMISRTMTGAELNEMFPQLGDDEI